MFPRGNCIVCDVDVGVAREKMPLLFPVPGPLCDLCLLTSVVLEISIDLPGHAQICT